MATPAFSARITVDTFSPALARVAKESPAKLVDAVKLYAFKVRESAVSAMRESTPRGRDYRRGGKTHTASAPGQPPARDTGQLVRSISWGSRGAEAEVGSDVMHGLVLEYGTVRMAARPWLSPALAAVEAELERSLDKVFDV